VLVAAFLKVLLQVCIVVIIWWGVGYPFAFGEGGPLQNAFIGGKVSNGRCAEVMLQLTAEVIVL
jgi:ammonia channel protein AmtB